MAVGKFFRTTVAPGLITGVAATTATHPFEQAQIGTENLPRRVDIRDASGKVTGSKPNPARFGTFKVPFSKKEIEFDKGDSLQHYAARVPKGIAGWGTLSLLGAGLKKMRFFR